MSNKLFVLNIICTVSELIVCLAVISTFAFMAWHFGKCWISLLTILPLMGYNGWKMIVDEREVNDHGRGEE